MKFLLTIHDRNGRELNLGDIVKVSDSSRFNFYCEVKYLEKDRIITPFHNFAFHSIEYADKVPDNAVKSNEERYNCWYVVDGESEDDKGEPFERYLMSWRECEIFLNKRMFRISMNDNKQTELFI
jgi:hypothetical protein